MKFSSLKVKVVAYLAVILVVVCLGLGISAYYVASSILVEEVEERLLEKAEDVSSLLQGRVSYHFQAVESIANRYVVRSMDWEVQRPALVEEAQRMSYNTFGVSDLQGNLRLVGSDGIIDISDRDYFVEMMQTRATTISEPIISRDDGTLVNAIVTPIRDLEGEMVGVLLTTMDGLEVINMVIDNRIGEMGYAYMLSRDGTFLAHDDLDLVLDRVNLIQEAEADPGYRELAQLFTRMVRGERGTGDYPFRGSIRYVGYAPVEGLGWSVAVGAVREDMLAGLGRLRSVVVLVSLAFLLISIALGAPVLGGLVAPIKVASDLMRVVAGGDLTGEVPEKYLGMNNEIGELAHNIKNMKESLVEMFCKIKDSTDKVDYTSESLASVTQEMSASLEEVAASSHEFSSNAQRLSEASQEMAEEGAGISENASQGDQAIHQAVNQMEVITGIVGSLKEIVVALDERSQEIGNIVETIKGIADQTNLLALNAAIEAARAGEEGRGFAVVAEEVRKLAEQSASAASEITNLVEATQVQTRNAVEDMDKGVVEVENGTGVIASTGDIFRSIIQAVEGITRKIDEVASSTEEISSGSQEISATVEEQTATMEEIASSSNELRGMVETLAGVLQQFKY